MADPHKSLTPLHPKPALPVGTKVLYHGSHPMYHGEYMITATVDRAGLEAVGRSIDHYFIDYTGYELWPIGVEHTYRNREMGLYFVRRGSITEIKPDPVKVKMGDVIHIIPESGPERVMEVAHVEHLIITLRDIVLEANDGN
jgi:hypothetical protein